jgi:hypothetical protein
MYTITRSFPVNEPGQVRLTRPEVWRGLEQKAREATRFVRRMQSCVVIEESGNQLVRDIVIRDEPHRERVTFVPEEIVRFERIGGNTTGSITNEIHEDADGSLRLQFSFSLERDDLPAGSEEEQAYFKKVESEYADAVRTTLETIRAARTASA